MSKLNLLILDANVVIHLHEVGIWEKFIDMNDVHLPRTVVDEADFYEEDEDRKYIDLGEIISQERITVFDVELSKLSSFQNQFDELYVSELDPGELEALAYLFNTKDEYLISSGDAIVYRVLGRMNKADLGISLEEILTKVGLQQSDTLWPYSKGFREKYTQEGLVDLMQDRGLKK